MSHELIFFAFFGFFVLVMLALDLGLFNKGDKPVSALNAAVMTMVWVSFALCFYAILYVNGNFLHNIHSIDELRVLIEKFHHPIRVSSNDFAISLELYNHNLAVEFITGYLVEYALSVDNIFVIVLIFTTFKVDKKHYHRVLFWGIIGAVLMRFLFIFIGASLIAKFSWILYVFGAFLIYTGAMMFIKRNDDEQIDTNKHPVVKFISKYCKVYPDFRGNKFFLKHNGFTMLTPLFIVLLIIEFTDLIFAVDSIPAIFAVTKDPYIVFFSNIFAIMGLRSMFFLLVNVIHKFHYLKVGLAFLLVFIGIKMLIHHQLEGIGFSNVHSLVVILFILGISVVFSLLFPKKQPNHVAVSDK